MNRLSGLEQHVSILPRHEQHGQEDHRPHRQTLQLNDACVAVGRYELDGEMPILLLHPNSGGEFVGVTKAVDMALDQARTAQLGYRITVLLDTNNSGAADGSDTKFHVAWDEGWRQVATFRESDSSPKEQFVNHQAGLDGSGGGSYIDTVITREKDANTAWTSASDGVLEERRYYCQNWRADVSAVLTSGGLMVEWVKYSSYGSPFGLPGGDANSSGGTDATDTTQIQTWINGSAYDVRGDINLNGVVNASDKTTVTNNYVGTTLGWNNLSAIGNRKGYAGYEWESQTGMYHVRVRPYKPDLGKWLRRDPLGYVDGGNLYEYVGSKSITHVDPKGTSNTTCPNSQNTPPGTNCAFYAAWNPMASDSPCCLDYDPDDTYFFANATCFCQCAGDSAWSQFVRACLRCEYAKGTPPGKAHTYCYAQADLMNFPGGRPWSALLACYEKCGMFNPPIDMPALPSHPWQPGPLAGICANCKDKT